MNPSHNLSHTVLNASDKAIVHILIIGVVLPLLDTTLVNVGLHAIGEQLGAALATVQWIVTAYTLAAASAVPLSAWLSQRIGAKRLWLACLWLFLLGAVLSAIAVNVEFLIASRIVQGVATGLLLPTMQTIVVMAVGQEKARAALSAMSVPSVLAPILGPLVGGLALQYFDWRLLFWLHVPICLLAIVLSTTGIPNKVEAVRASSKFDWPGFLLLCPALILLVYGISQLDTGLSLGAEPDIAWPQIAWLVPCLAGLGLLLAFIAYAYRHQGAAIIDVILFKLQNFRASCSLLFLSSVAYYGGILLLPLYLMQVGDYQPKMAGLLLALHGVGILLARKRLPALSRTWGDRTIAYAAIALALAGSILLSLPQLLGSQYMMAAAMMLRGAGVGVLTILSMSGAYQGLTSSQVTHASSLTRIITHLGATIGASAIAILATAAGNVPEVSSYAGGSSYLYAHWALIAVVALCAWSARRLPRPSA